MLKDNAQVNKKLGGHPLAVSGQLAQSNPDASHHFILLVVI